MPYIVVTLAGLALGSVASVLLPKAYREEPLLGSVTWCASCGTSATPRDFIPLVSAGRCRSCAAGLPITRVLLPIGGAVLGLICSLEFHGLEEALVASVFCTILLTLAATDIDRHFLPDRIVLPGMLLGVGTAWILPGMSILDSAYGGLVGIGLAAVLVAGSLLFGAEAFGMGDAKLIVMLGLLLGPTSVIVAVFIAAILAGVFAIAALATRRRRFGDYLPLGPFLVAGGIAALLWGQEIWNWYSG